MTEFKVRLFMVSSLDGVVSRSPLESVNTWASEEDQKHLSTALEACDAIITGRRSFSKKRADVPHYIFSRTRQSTEEELKAGVHFVNQSPEGLVQSLESHGLSQILLLGGPSINRLFLEKQLVDELVLTVEPLIFGEGLRLVDKKMEQCLKLQNCEVMNSQGGLLLTYKVIKSCY